MANLPKNPQKIWDMDFERTNSKNSLLIVPGQDFGNIYSVSISNFENFPKMAQFDFDDSGEMVGIFTDVKPKINSRSRKQQKNLI